MRGNEETKYVRGKNKFDASLREVNNDSVKSKLWPDRIQVERAICIPSTTYQILPRRLGQSRRVTWLLSKRTKFYFLLVIFIQEEDGESSVPERPFLAPNSRRVLSATTETSEAE